MTVKELKAQLNKYPDNMDVFMAERKTEFTYGLLNSVSCEEINFVEGLGEKVLSVEQVIVLDEE